MEDSVMKKLILGLAALALLLANVTQLQAGPLNVLVWSSGNADGNTPAIASWLQASGQFGTVTGVNTNTTMTLAQLSAYDAVLYFSNHSEGQDSTGIGNVLADYAHTGKRLVLATFAWANQVSNTLGGRLITDGISPLLFTTSSAYSNVTMSSNDGSGFFTDVHTINGYFHDNVHLSNGAVSRATWSDGNTLLATKGNVVGIDLFPEDRFGTVSGDYRQLFVNSLAFGSSAPAVPEPASLTMVGFGIAGMMGYAWRRKRKTAVAAA